MSMLETLFAEFDWQLLIKTGFRISLVLIIAWFVSKLLTSGLKQLEQSLIHRSTLRGERPVESQKRIETIIRLLKQGGLLAIWIIVLLITLREIGVEIGPIIASAGIVGLAVGFGAQNLVRDFISGFFMILDNQIRIGDVAIINGTGGLVEQINFRTTVLRDLAGVVHYFPNGTISSLSNLTNDWSAYVFDIGVAYKENTDDVIVIIRSVLDSMRDDEHFGAMIFAEPEIFGVDKLADSSVVIKGRIKTKPIKQWDVGREFLRRVKLRFDQEGIEIPFPHQTVYFGESSKPFDIKMLDSLVKAEVKS